MRSARQMRQQTALAQPLLPGRAVQQMARPGKPGRRRRLDAQALAVMQPRQIAVQGVVGDGVDAGQRLADGGIRQVGGARHRQAVGLGLVGQADVVDRRRHRHAGQLAMAGHHAQQEARRLHRFGKEAVRVRAVQQRQAEGDAAGRAAHAAGQVDEQRMLGIDHDAGLRDLVAQPQRRRRVAQEQRGRALVVDEVAARIGLDLAAAGGHGLFVIAGVFHHLDAPGAQARLLPCLGVGRHVHGGAKAQRRSDHADGQAQVAGRSDGHLVLRETGAGRGRGELAVIIAGRDQALRPRQLLGEFQHLMNAATRLDRTGHRQRVVGLDPQASAIRRQAQRLLHGGGLAQRRLDHAGRGFQFGEQLRQQRREAREAVVGRLHVGQAEGDAGVGRAAIGAGPQQRLRRAQRLQ
ncbi:Uncharacterised protein [Achromobacter xylosoxidans]|nr:Uncharacterised protein [Achromobacter xylosoxidans]